MVATAHFFITGHLLKASNSYFLTFIPKFGSPKTFFYCRPIGLLNFTFKIISKILAKGLALIMPNLISKPLWGRSINDHSASSHDLFQKLNSKVSRGSDCIKLDISKAFDKLLWSFLFKALHFFKFSPLDKYD